MDQTTQLMQIAASGVTERVDAVPDDAWTAQSPCEDWTVRDVVAHLTAEHLWAPHLLRGESVEQVGDRYDGDVLGADPPAAWAAAREASMAAWAQTDPAFEVQLSSGASPASEYAEQMLLDLTVHAWDVARGAGLSERLDPACAEHVLGYVRRHHDELSSASIFGPAVDTRSDESQDQLLALLGRRP